MSDSWVHRVKAERRRKSDHAVTVLVCVEDANAAPPEDSGGVWGYSSNLKVLSDTKDADHEYILGWFGAGWGATAFDIAKAKQWLRARFTPSKTTARR